RSSFAEQKLGEAARREERWVERLTSLCFISRRLRLASFDAACSQTQGPDYRSCFLGVSPKRHQRMGQFRYGVESFCGNKILRSRPGSQISEEVIKGPSGLHFEGG